MAPNPRVYLDVGSFVEGKHVGRIIIELFTDTTLHTAENFRSICTGENSGEVQYNGTTFDYVLPTMCKGRKVQPGKRELVSIFGRLAKAENFIKKHNGPGTVSMRCPNGPEFLITTEKSPQYDGKHVAVGKVMEGLDVVGEITNWASKANTYPVKLFYITASVQLRESNISPSQQMSPKEFEQLASTSNNQLSNSLKEVMNVNKQLVTVDPKGVDVPQNEKELVEAAAIFRRSLSVLADLKAEVFSLEKRHKELLSKTETKISNVKNKRLFLETIPTLSYEELENIENGIKKWKRDIRNLFIVLTLHLPLLFRLLALNIWSLIIELFSCSNLWYLT